MRTIEYQFKYALSVADNNPSARIGFFCKRSTVVDLIQSADDLQGVFHKQTMEYVSKSGGVISFIDIYKDLAYPNLAGYQFSHCFITEDTSYEFLFYIKSRLRCPTNVVKELTEPMGLYFRWGVERIMEY